MATGTRKPSTAVPAEVPTTAVLSDDKVVEQVKEIYKDDLPKGVHGKLNLILARMPEDMRPEGNNAHFHYKYWSLDQISGYFRNRFGELGLSFMADVVDFDIKEHPTAREGRSFLTTMRVLFTITDSDTGETISGHGIGQGDDPGDKGANKAFSGALKYWLLKVFIVGGDDAEADERTDRRSERNGRRRGSNDEAQSVTITESKIEGIARGGRANKTTDAQLRQIRTLARELEWNAAGTAKRIAEWVGDDVVLPDEVEDQPEALVRYLEGLGADDAGLIITKMIDLRDAPDEDGHDDDRDDRHAGYGDYP